MDPKINPAEFDEKQLNRRKEEKRNDDGRGAEGKSVPIEKLGRQIAEGNQEADRRQAEAGHGRDTQRQLRMAGDAKHSHVVQGVEIVMRDAADSLRLIIGNGGEAEAQLRDESAKIGVGVIELADGIDDFTVVESEAGEVRYQRDFRNATDDAVVGAANDRHRPGFPAGGLDPDDDLVSFLPAGYQFRDHLRGILQVGRHGDHGIALRL